MDKWVPKLSYCEQTSNLQSLAICSDVALTGWPLPFHCSPDPISLTCLTRLFTAILEQLKVGCSFQILLAFNPFFRKSFFMTAICSVVKAIFLNYVRNLSNCQYRK